jgi:hypothetical protein
MLSFADSRVFAFSPEFAREWLAPLQETLNDSGGVYLEHALARAIHGAMADGKRWRPLPLEPVVIGCGGTSGRSYGTGRLRLLLRRTRRTILRRLLAR